MFLLSLNRLREAQEEFQRVAAARRDAAPIKGLAIVKARQGLLDEARELAARGNAAPHGTSFKTTEEQLQEELQIGKRFAALGH
jgi:hypothetical protein